MGQHNHIDHINRNHHHHYHNTWGATGDDYKDYEDSYDKDAEPVYNRKGWRRRAERREIADDVHGTKTAGELQCSVADADGRCTTSTTGAAEAGEF